MDNILKNKEKMNLNTWWKNRSYWQKGALIGIVFGLIIFSTVYIKSLFPVIWWFGARTVCEIFPDNNLCAMSVFLYGWITLPIFYGILGLLLGYVIGKIKLKNWWKKKSYWQKGLIIGLIIGLLKVPFVTLFEEIMPSFILNIFSIIPDYRICDSIKDCGFFVFVYGFISNSIFYGIIGALIGLIIGKVKGK